MTLYSMGCSLTNDNISNGSDTSNLQTLRAKKYYSY
jgi:hypothetical protein